MTVGRLAEEHAADSPSAWMAALPLPDDAALVAGLDPSLVSTPAHPHGFLRTSLQLATAVLRHPGVRGGRLSAAARVLRWQVGKARGARRARIRLGPVQLYCYPGSTAASSMLYFGLPEWDDMTFVLRYLRPGDAFLDIGANVGTYTILAATAAEGVQVSAVEPDMGALARLVENVRLNELQSVSVVRAAVCTRCGPVAFTQGRDSVNRIAREGDAEIVWVPTVTLDALTAERAPALVKIDVEGAELEVLRSGPRALKRDPSPVLLFEINDGCRTFGTTPREIAAFLGEQGYSLFEYDARSNTLDPYSPRRLPRGGNVVATRDAGAVIRRIATVAVPAYARSPARVQVALER